jgi:hypothetical protein
LNQSFLHQHFGKTFLNKEFLIERYFSEREVDIDEYENQIKSLTYERDELLERNKQLENDIHEIQSNVDMYELFSRNSSFIFFLFF